MTAIQGAEPQPEPSASSAATPTRRKRKDRSDLVAKKKHSLALRWMHWINFPVLMIMMYSGMRIYTSDPRDPYAIGIFGWEIFEFWPEAIDGRDEFLQLRGRLARGIAFHLNFGWLFVANGLAYLIYLSRKGNWRYLVPDRQGLRDIGKVLLHDLHLRKTAPPQGKYNAMQQLTYTLVIIMAAVLVLSGFAIYKPTQLSLLVTLMGGYGTARFLHFSTTIILMGFFLIHILQVIRAGWRNFASMVTGYRLEPRPPQPVRKADSDADAGRPTVGASS
jgi:thiosulfate reductase cytochrome b subunit